MASGIIPTTLTIHKVHFSTTVGNYGEIACATTGATDVTNIIGIQLTKVGAATDPSNILCIPRVLGRRVKGFYLQDLVSKQSIAANTAVEGNYFYINN